MWDNLYVYSSSNNIILLLSYWRNVLLFLFWSFWKKLCVYYEKIERMENENSEIGDVLVFFIVGRKYDWGYILLCEKLL